MMSKYSTKQVEYKALRTLEIVCQYPTGRLVLCDRPDLQDDNASYGVEVVEDCQENQRIVESIIPDIWEKKYSTIPSHKLKALRKYGGQEGVTDGIVNWCLVGEGPTDINHLLSTIQTKIKKLNEGGYKSFHSYGLFVFVDTVALYDSYVASLLEDLSKLQYPIMYKTIYLEQHFEILICDTKTKTYTRKQILKADRDSINNEVKEFGKTDCR